MSGKAALLLCAALVHASEDLPWTRMTDQQVNTAQNNMWALRLSFPPRSTEAEQALGDGSKLRAMGENVEVVAPTSSQFPLFPQADYKGGWSISYQVKLEYEPGAAEGMSGTSLVAEEPGGQSHQDVLLYEIKVWFKPEEAAGSFDSFRLTVTYGHMMRRSQAYLRYQPSTESTAGMQLNGLTGLRTLTSDNANIIDVIDLFASITFGPPPDTRTPPYIVNWELEAIFVTPEGTESAGAAFQIPLVEILPPETSIYRSFRWLTNAEDRAARKRAYEDRPRNPTKIWPFTGRPFSTGW